MLIKKLFTFVVILYCSYHSLVDYGSFYNFLLTPNSFVCIFSFCLQFCWKHITWLDLQILRKHSNLYHKLKTIYFWNANNFFLVSITLRQIDVKMKHSLVIVHRISISFGRNCSIITWTSWDFNYLKKFTQDNFSFSWQSMITKFWYIRLSFLTLYKYGFSLITSLIFPNTFNNIPNTLSKSFFNKYNIKNNILHTMTSNMAIQRKFTLSIPFDKFTCTMLSKILVQIFYYVI